MFSDMVSFIVLILTVALKLFWVASNDICVHFKMLYFSKPADDFEVSNTINCSNEIELNIMCIVLINDNNL